LVASSSLARPTKAKEAEKSAKLFGSRKPIGLIKPDSVKEVLKNIHSAGQGLKKLSIIEVFADC
jgi:hypothetical protein